MLRYTKVMAKGKKNKVSVKNDMRYVSYVVSMYLRGKSELEEFREDLNQEGLLALLAARVQYNEKLGFPKDLFLHYRIKQSIQNYITRTEVKHFKGTPKDSLDDTLEDTPYWDLGDPTLLEDLIDTNGTLVDGDRITHFLSRIEMTTQEEKVIELYLRIGNYSEVGENLGLSRQRVHQIMGIVIDKCKNLLDI